MRAFFFSTLIGAAALSFTIVPADAQDAGPPPAPVAPEIDTGGDSVTIAVGVATVPSYEGSDNNRIIPAGAARGTLGGYAFATRGAKLFVDLVRNNPGPVWDFQAGPVVGVNFNRTSALGDRQVQRLGDRKLAIEAGGYIGIGKTGVITSPYDKLSLSVSYIHDVSGVYKSYVVTPQLDYGTPLSRHAFVGISASASYAGEGYADAYFAVSPIGSARSNLPIYNPRAGWKNWSVSAIGLRSITGDLLHGLAVGGGVSYSRLLNDFGDSPVTSVAGSRNQFFGALGLAYTF